MGLVYANAGMFRCALRWQREAIVRMEANRADLCTDMENVYASVGYSLYSLGLFEEAISWAKSCIGSRVVSEAIARALVSYDSELAAGSIRAIERSGSRTRITAAAFDPARVGKASPRLEEAIKDCALFQEYYVDWISPETPVFEIELGGYPFRAERDVGSLVRHKMNLIFATCARADALVEIGRMAEAKRLLSEVALVEPAAQMVWDRLKLLAK